MENIREIKLFDNDFFVFFDNTTLKLNCKNETDICTVDISDMNLINAVRFAILCSTHFFIKNFKQKLCWVVGDEEIKRAISILRLKNIKKCMVNASKERLVRAS